VLLQAIKDRASDIHFEPFETSSRCGTASTACCTRWSRRRKHLGPAITSRVKVMANLDIAERRLPQDGRIELRWAATRSTSASRCSRRCTARAS
jgi:type IV pilus assembly protein PilB